MSGTTKRRLILAPHHDDAEFGLGGAIQKWVAAGDQVRVVVACDGDYDRGGTCVEGGLRELESLAALKLLAASTVRFAGWFRENAGAHAHYPKLVRQIEEEISAAMPHETYVCLSSFNQDHRALFDATVTAFRPGGAKGALLAYEYPGNGWGPAPPVCGKRYIELTMAQLMQKTAALHLHKSQFLGRSSYGVTPEGAHALAGLRGHEAGTAWAELVYLLKEVI